MAEPDTQADTPKSLTPYIAMGGGVIAILAVLFLVLSSGEEPEPEPVEVDIAVVTEPDPEPSPEQPEEVYVAPDPVPVPDPLPEPEPEPEPTPEPEPLDISDGAVKTALLALSMVPKEFGSLLVDDDLLRRFVIFTNNIPDKKLASNHHLLRDPDSSFRVYQQAGKEWIDSASYQRYTGYVDILDNIEASQLLELYQKYKDPINEIYAEETPNSDEDFDFRLIDAIDHLLDTPEIPVPVEVYTDSVMYKYRITQVEDLSPPQKQLLRTGPENMRVIKSKLREIKALVEAL